MVGDRTVILAGSVAGIAGWLLAVSIYLFPSWGRPLAVPILVFSPFLIWMFGYAIATPLLPSWRPWTRALLVSVPYLVIGGVLLSLAIASRGFGGVPPFFVLIWPIGVLFVLFSERVNDPLELVSLLTVGVAIFCAGGLFAGLLEWRRREGG
ncbi:MAG: hypothetical protein ACE5I4_03400 [Thermoplasmata archaeon]